MAAPARGLARPAGARPLPSPRMPSPARGNRSSSGRAIAADPAVARRSPGRAPATIESAPSRPDLRVVDRRLRSGADRHRRARALAVVGGALLLGSLLATAASHAFLVSAQAELDGLQAQVTEAQARYSRARLQVAELEAPERIVRVAQERLGMVPPPRVIYLSPSEAVAAEVGAGDVSEPAPTTATAGGSWTRIKPYLASQRP